MPSYADFLRRKAITDPCTGIPGEINLPEFLFPHQHDITKWALRRGRAAIFAGTGLGKTNCELVWGDKVSSYTGKPVLILAPLAVASQHAREADKFGISARVVRGMDDVSGTGIFITNYAKFDRFDMRAFGGVVLDESGILKSVDGKTRQKLVTSCQNIPFRVAATATPAPNDFMELGNHAEFLGVMSYTEMLSMFFVHDGGETQKWRLKGHAESEFWKWMTTWAVMLRRPSDLGYRNEGYDLPALVTKQHIANVKYEHNIEDGTLFPIEARTMQERIGARKSSITDRVEMAAKIVATKPNVPWVVWCQLNAESSALAKAIPGSVEIVGSDDDEIKERKLDDFSCGRTRIIITKPSMTAHGCNWQHCADTVFCGLNDSFEQVFQAVRRFWRFGQTKEVTAHFIASELEGAVVANLKRKEADADRMADAMISHMADLSSMELHGTAREKASYAAKIVDLPKFMR